MQNCKTVRFTPAILTTTMLMCYSKFNPRLVCIKYAGRVSERFENEKKCAENTKRLLEFIHTTKQYDFVKSLFVAFRADKHTLHSVPFYDRERDVNELIPDSVEKNHSFI